MPRPPRKPLAVRPLRWNELATAESSPSLSPCGLREMMACGVDSTSPLVRVLGAWRGETLVGAAWGEVQSGRSGYLHPPRLRAGEPIETIANLLEEWESWLLDQEVRFYQVQLDDSRPPDAAFLLAAGMHHAGDLLYLESEVERATAPACDLEFEAYCEDRSDRMAAIIAATYPGSLDLPMLDDVRTPEEVLAGYRATGAFRPERWRFVRGGGEDLGCLLLTEHPGRQWELIYMGVVPQARGRGLGLCITRQAQFLVRQFGGERLLLAVDAANIPALAAYRAAGFEPWRRSSVFLKMLRPARGPAATLERGGS